MTEKIELYVMGIEHMMKQPMGRRYALFCSDAFKKPSLTDCDSKSRMGHMGDFADYSEGRGIAISHPHDVLIRFYPDSDNKLPSEDFISDFTNQEIETE